MEVRISDPALLSDLESYLRRCGAHVHALSDSVLDVHVHAPTIDPIPRLPEVELDAYLRVWAAIREPATATRRPIAAVG